MGGRRCGVGLVESKPRDPWKAIAGAGATGAIAGVRWAELRRAAVVIVATRISTMWVIG